MHINISVKEYKYRGNLKTNNIKSEKLSQLANCIRFLSIDAVQKANSGHPGMPMGMADIATILFKNHLKFDPNDPKWIDKDRFILSNGHGSMLLYACLYLTGYKDISLDNIKNFRQIGSPTAGHPEYGELAGVETKDFAGGKPGFSGSHDSTIALVQSGSYEVGALNKQVWESNLASKRLNTSNVNVIWTTPPYADYHWLAQPNLDNKMGIGFTARLTKTFLGLNKLDSFSHII